nr:MAG TPA: hypothetical protein [Caudoviricetes sp.]
MAPPQKHTPDIRQPILWHCPSTGLAHLYKQRGLAGSDEGSRTEHGLMVLDRT